MPEVTALGPLLTLRMDPLAKLERLDLPVLVVHGSNDTIVPPEMAQRLFAAARGPKRLVMVEGATHSGVLRRGRRGSIRRDARTDRRAALIQRGSGAPGGSFPYLRRCSASSSRSVL